MNQLLRDDVEFKQIDKYKRLFQTLKQVLRSSLILAYYNPEALTQIETDALDSIVGAVLLQQGKDEFQHLVAYFSKTIDVHQQRYKIYNKEILAIILALRDQRTELEGLQRKDRFSIQTNYRVLEYFITKRSLNTRQYRQIDDLSRYYFLIRYRLGSRNQLADILSRKDKVDRTKPEYTLLLLEYLKQGILLDWPPILVPVEQEESIID